MPPMPEGYYDRFNPTKHYERHLYRAGRVVQGAELNETQLSSIDRLKQVADALFKDGSVVRDAGINVNQDTGETRLAAGVLYARGAMRGVAPATLTVPLTGTVAVGIFLQETVVTENDDGELRDPAIDVRNYAEPGAARLKVQAVWGKFGDGSPGDFYPVYTVIDGVVQSTEPPPAIDAIGLAIAAYDRDSTGGYYISDGLLATAMADDNLGRQVYSLSSGNARVGGRQVLLAHARRIVYDAGPDLKQVLSEPHLATGGAERVNTNHAPIDTIDAVLITTQRTVSVVHGAFTGVSDILPDSPVVALVSVVQGATTYAVNSDYRLTADAVDWSPGGNEPAPGSTYQVVYQYYAQVTPSSPDVRGFNVSGAVPGTNIQISYRWRRPRIDKLCLDASGAVVWVKGTPNDTAPRPPTVSEGLLAVATVSQTWTDVTLTVGNRTVAARKVANDGVRVQTMDQLLSLEGKVDNLFALVGEQQLKTEAALSDPTTKRGTSYDNFMDDDMRDAGVAQTAAVVDGALTLAVSNVQVRTVSLNGVQTLPLNNAGIYPVISQTLRTGSMLCNPYMAYEPIPARCTLEPATDFWTETQTVWASPNTRRFTTEREVIDRVTSLGWLTRQIGVTRDVVVTSTTELVSTRTAEAQWLRQIQISFQVQGFGPGEVLNEVRFDGVSVPFTA